MQFMERNDHKNELLQCITIYHNFNLFFTPLNSGGLGRRHPGL